MLWLKSNIRVLVVVGVFIFGALVNGWYRDSQEAVKARKDVVDVLVEIQRQGAIASGWEVELAKLNQRRDKVTHEIKTIVERPIYSAQCIDVDGMRLVNALKNGRDPGKPVEGLPGASGPSVPVRGVHPTNPGGVGGGVP